MPFGRYTKMLNKVISHICPECQTELSTFSGISKKTNKPYIAHKCPECGYIEFEKSATFKKKSEENPDGNLVVMEEINGINGRIDKLIAYVIRWEKSLVALEELLKRFQNEDKIVIYPSEKELK